MRDEAFQTRFGRQLRAFREAEGLTQRELAERADLAEKYVSRLEGGAAMPSLSVAARLAAGLGVGVEAFMEIASASARPDPDLGRFLALLRGRSASQLDLAHRLLVELFREESAGARRGRGGGRKGRGG